MKRIEFSAKVRDKAADRAAGICQRCRLPFAGKKMHFDHILPLALGGESSLANCQVLCEPCHAQKTAKEDVPRIRKADRVKRAARGIKASDGPKIQSRPFQVKQRAEKLPLPKKRNMYEDVK